ncbi:MAG: aspartate aminotransferase, partial [Legionellales bacterium]|nr:aspartate aminotransferase [Legionellales bacterium]
MELSKRLSGVEPSESFSIAHRLSQLKKAGHSIIPMNLGEAEMDTPLNIASAGIEAIHNGFTRYTPIAGTMRLKKAIIHKFQRENGIEFSKSEVMVSSGSKQCISNALLALLNIGDEVIIPAPYWSPYPDMVKIAGGKPKIVHPKNKKSFKLSPEDLRKAITRKTKILIINSPSNPTGVIYSKEELQKIGEVLKEFPYVYIISDDVYEKVLWTEQPFCNMMMACPDLRSRIITINSVSKSHAMTGWRIGFAGADEKIIEGMTKIQSHTSACPNSIAQYAAREALECDQSMIMEQCDQYQENHNFVLQRLGQIDGIEIQPADGTF